MNKDLDDRLIPNGEYRDAQNISVGKSEEDDIGSLENVLGNTQQIITINPALPDNMTIIGYLSDEYTGKLYIFSTNYTDGFPETTPTYPPSTKRCIIYAFTPGNQNAIVIADDIFLNFSTTNPIQVSLIENLLFFTDNRNGPRKVNINQTSTYYTNEEQLSVAKYNPYLPIKLFKKEIATAKAGSDTTAISVEIAANSNVKVGMSIISTSSSGTVKISSSDYLTVVFVNSDSTVVSFSKAVTTPIVGDIFTFISSTMTDESQTTNWPGDPDYLESKYVRFSYRYRFDDGEYSIMAPFTQIAYVPKQKGYFVNGDEDAAYRSTIVEFMENRINNIELLIDLPCDQIDLDNKFHISSIDILYKESDGLSIKVLETINRADIQDQASNNVFPYNYQSRKPYKTLPSNQTARVYDVVPVRALSQETAGNRIIYGNFRNAYTAPENIQYDVKITDKGSKNSTSWIEYPNHSLKQNRNYQVGFVLADKYGRQSPVILSPVKQTQVDLGSTLFSPYNTAVSDMKAWFGDTLQLSVTSPITSTPTGYPNFTEGKPGLYAIPINSGTDIPGGFAITSAATNIIQFTYQTGPSSVSNTLNKYNFTLNTVNSPSNITTPVVGDYLTGEFIDYVKVTSVSAPGTTTTAQTSANGNNTALFLSTLNINITVGMVITGFAGGISRTVTQIFFPDEGVNNNNYKSLVGLNQSVSFNSSEVLTFTSPANNYVVYTDGKVNSSYGNNTTTGALADVKFSYKINPIGWYSYKIVVKQTEQEYYNVYLPGILKGYPLVTTGSDPTPIPFPNDPVGSTSNIVLFNDNINKVPRDLNEVSDQQKQFRSSVQLHGRVQNNSATTNIQFFPGVLTDTAISISTSDDANMSYLNLSTSTNAPAAPGGQDNLYQIDTKPLVGRLSTSQPIGSLTNVMRPFLAIYETEPVDSLLDIFWETNTVGLISDLNADVLTGSDEPVAFTADNFELLESDAINHDLTDYFFPISNEGVLFDSAYPTTLVQATYISQRDVAAGNSAVNMTSGGSLFSMDYNTTTKAYRIKSNSEFVYQADSSTLDLYSFSIQIKVDSASPLAPNATPTLAITGAFLKNVAPSFDLAVLPTISIDVDTVTTPFPGQNTAAKNGTIKDDGSPVGNQIELKWSIVSGNPTGANGNPSFAIDSTNGNLSQIFNNTPSGQHTLVLKVEDCDGTAGVGSLPSITKNQIINVGPIQANTGIRSTCITGPINTALPGGGIQIPPILVTKVPLPSGNSITGVFYLSDSTLDASDFFNGSTAIAIPNTAQSGDASLTNTIFKIGDALTKGTLSLSLNAGMTWAGSQVGPSSGLVGNIFWRVYHRTNSSSNWAAIIDLNNTTFDNTLNSGKGLKMEVNTAYVHGYPFGAGSYYEQFVLAYNQIGEYLIVAEAINPLAPVQSNAVCAWVNSNDLYYSTCVIEGGTNFAPATNPSAAGAAQSYKYTIDRTSSNTAFYCHSGGSFSTEVYSHVPYGKYITQLYDTANLTSIKTTLIDAGSGITNYLAFITGGSSPYYGPAGFPTSIFFSGRFSTASAKVYKPNPWSQNYISPCSIFYRFPR